MKAHGEAISTGVPVDCTGAWVLMHAAMGAIDTLLQSEDLDLDSPCYTDADGSNPYYTPLQQLCLLNKKLMPGSWTSDLAIKLSRRGASHDVPDFWTSKMKSHAKLWLAAEIISSPNDPQSLVSH